MAQNRENAAAWCALLRAPGLGPARIRALLDACGNARTAAAATPSQLRACGVPEAAMAWLAKPDAARIEADLEWLAAPMHHLIGIDDPDYPVMLRRSPHPPAALFVDGDPNWLWFAQVAVVGSRNPTEGGRANARDFSREMACAGFIVTSGLAEGIDAAAHRAALDAGRPTIAVVATGPDRVYPAKHRELADAIAACGAIVTEFPPGTDARREHFPARNRIIAGLSLGTLVVEAALRSGALITARQAAEASREVFALPGSIHNPMARGPHKLIRDGAQLVEAAQEVIDALAPAAALLADALRGRLMPESGKPSSPVATRTEEPDSGELDSGDADYRKLLAALGHDPVPIDVLAQRTGLTVPSLSSMLLLMELDGRVVAENGRYSRLQPENVPQRASGNAQAEDG
ncbi:MAG: DNA-processing protein DprA [Lysobacteraceae bacterium]